MVMTISAEQKRRYAREGTVVAHIDQTAEHYLASDNIKLAVELDEVTDEADDHLIKATFDFRNARYEDRDKHTVDRLVSLTQQMSQTIRRLEFLTQGRLSSNHEGFVGSTGSPKGDFDKLLELTANAAYVVGVLQGAKLQGASPDRLERIKSFATL